MSRTNPKGLSKALKHSAADNPFQYGLIHHKLQLMNIFKITKKAKNSLARKGIVRTLHGEFQTPVFMPCATVGAVKGVSAEELKILGYEIILGNTYHLYLRPGEKEIKKLGGIQKFINWNGPVLTDSGGYQIFSLGHNFRNYGDAIREALLVNVRSDGVWFRSHIDGTKHFFSPEKVLEIQKDLGSDILMVLDECTEFPATKERAQYSVEMTNTWAKRSIDYWKRFGHKKQAIFGIIQGSIYQDLREKAAEFINSLGFDGIAVGGVSVGEGKANMYKVIKWVGPILPPDKPHYLMGVGEPEDILEAVKWGFDMFDCVLPTRLGRHGTVWVTTNWKKFPKIDLRKSRYRQDSQKIMKNCQCPSCSAGYSRAYISHLIRNNEMLGMRLASLHNLWILSELMRRIGKSI